MCGFTRVPVVLSQCFYMHVSIFVWILLGTDFGGFVSMFFLCMSPFFCGSYWVQTLVALSGSFLCESLSFVCGLVSVIMSKFLCIILVDFFVRGC